MKIQMIRWGMFIALVVGLVFLAGCSGAGEKHFKVMMSIAFESDLSKIPDYPAGTPYSEPVGLGVVEMEVVFPKGGGSALSQSGEIRLTDYHEQGPYCTLEIPEDMIGATSAVSWSDIYWDPQGRMTFTGDVKFENPAFTIVAACPPTSVPLEEYPLYKLMGVFNEKLYSLSVDLSADGAYFEDLGWGMYDTMQTDLEIAIQAIE